MERAFCTNLSKMLNQCLTCADCIIKIVVVKFNLFGSEQVIYIKYKSETSSGDFGRAFDDDQLDQAIETINDIKRDPERHGYAPEVSGMYLWLENENCEIVWS